MNRPHDAREGRGGSRTSAPTTSAASSPEFGTSGVQKSERTEPGAATTCDCPDFKGPGDTRHVCPVHGPLYSDDSDAAKLQDAHRRVFEVLHQAEVAARICEQERNEGDAEAIRRDAIRSVLALGIGEPIPSRFDDYWRTHSSKL